MCRFHFWSQFVHISPPGGIKNCLRGGKNQNRFLKVISRLRGVTMFLITDSESTHKVTSIVKFLGSISICMESWAPNPDFGQNHVFAVREQLHRFRTKPTPDSDSPWSKVPSTIWNHVFFWYLKYTMCATPFVLLYWPHTNYVMHYKGRGWHPFYIVIL